MSLEIFDYPQNSPEWMEIRRGTPTASMFATILAKGRDGGASLTRRTYMMKLAGEIITGDLMDSYSNDHMARGHVMESEARSLYSFLCDEPMKLVGFIRNGNAGASPDALIGDSGLLEIKTKLPHLLIGDLLKDEPPPEFMAQCQGGMWIAEREFVDLVVYWPKMPLFAKRVFREPAYIAKLSAAVDKFNEELAAVVEKVRRYGTTEARAA